MVFLIHGSGNGSSIIATKSVGVHSALITHCKNTYGVEAGISTELERLIEKKITNKILLLGIRVRYQVLENESAKKKQTIQRPFINLKTSISVKYILGCLKNQEIMSVIIKKKRVCILLMRNGSKPE
jgi:hypothetical protein